MQDREPGPFDRILQSEPIKQRDTAATLIVGAAVALGLLLLVLVLPPISILEGDGQSSAPGAVTTTARDELPAPPPGYEAVSALLDLQTSGSALTPARLTVKLTAPVSADDELALFTYQDGSWRRLGDAVPLAGGDAAQGEAPFVPPNVAVLRAVAGARLVLGSLPAGAELDERALESIAILNIEGFKPSPAGGVTGEAPDLPPGLDVEIAPTISARSSGEIGALNGILGSQELRAAHVDSILAFAAEGGYDGIDLDYRAIDPALDEEFVSFVRELSAGLAEDGRTLTLTLPPPAREGEGWNTQGFVWEELAPLARAVKIAPVAEGDQYFARMEEALGYLAPRVGTAKLLLTVSPLSRERGADGVRSLTLLEALALASVPSLEGESPVAPNASVQLAGTNLTSRTGTGGLRWDAVARAVTFTYTGAGGERTVWLSNLFSEGFKLDLAGRYALGGVAVEDVSQGGAEANVWPAVLQYAQTGAVQLVTPNGTLLEPSWTASDGAFDSTSGATVTWRAPAQPGDYTLTLIVSDGVIRVGQELIVPVEAPDSAARP